MTIVRRKAFLPMMTCHPPIQVSLWNGCIGVSFQFCPPPPQEMQSIGGGGPQINCLGAGRGACWEAAPALGSPFVTLHLPSSHPSCQIPRGLGLRPLGMRDQDWGRGCTCRGRELSLALGRRCGVGSADQLGLRMLLLLSMHLLDLPPQTAGF